MAEDEDERRRGEPDEELRELLLAAQRLAEVDRLKQRGDAVSDLPCNFRREGGQSLVIGGSSLVILEGREGNPL